MNGRLVLPPQASIEGRVREKEGGFRPYISWGWNQLERVRGVLADPDSDELFVIGEWGFIYPTHLTERGLVVEGPGKQIESRRGVAA